MQFLCSKTLDDIVQTVIQKALQDVYMKETSYVQFLNARNKEKLSLCRLANHAKIESAALSDWVKALKVHAETEARDKRKVSDLKSSFEYATDAKGILDSKLDLSENQIIELEKKQQELQCKLDRSEQERHNVESELAKTRQNFSASK
eukprot:2619364-Ditylum_brightwellii.AAC.1